MINKLKAAFKNKDFSELLLGGYWAIKFRILGILLMFGIILFITRSFGVDKYGEYVLFFSTINLLAVSTNFGLDTLMIKKIPLFKNKLNWNLVKWEMKKTYASILMLGGTLSFLIILFSTTISNYLEVSRLYVILLGVVIIPHTVFKLHNQCFRGDKNIKFYSFFEFVVLFLSLFVTIGISKFLFPDLSGDLLIIDLVIAILISVSLNSFLWHKKINQQVSLDAAVKGGAITIQNIFNNLKESFPFLLISGLTLFSMWTIQVTLKLYASSADLGIYDAILKITLLIAMPLMAVNSITAPKLSETVNDPLKLKNIGRISTLIAICCSLPIGLVLFLFPEVIVLLYGEEFAKGIPTLRVLVAAQMVNACSGPVQILLQMTGHEKVARNIVLICTVICVSTCLILIPKMGILGAAIAYFCTLSTGAVLNVLVIYKQFGFITIGLPSRT